jgi:hypothetical protein
MSGSITGAVALASLFVLAGLLRLRPDAFAWGATADDLSHDWPGGSSFSPQRRVGASLLCVLEGRSDPASSRPFYVP